MGHSFSKCCACKQLMPFPSPGNDSTPLARPPRVYNRKYKEVGLIGCGGFGKVYLVKSVRSQQQFALKKLSKRLLLAGQRELNLKSILAERHILMTVKTPFVVKLYHCFQDQSNLYFVLEYCEGGSLERYLRRTIVFSEASARFLVCEILVALQVLHEEYAVIYRDLKPENILLCSDGHVKLADFGLSVMGKTTSVSDCGTPEFVAPEVLNGTPYTRVVDLWSLGCLTFVLLYGRFPFAHRKQTALFELIRKGRFEFPTFPSVSAEAKDLIRSLLKVNPAERLGAEGTSAVTQHPFFHGVDWEAVRARTVESPISVQSTGVVRAPRGLSPPTSERISHFTYEVEETVIKAKSF